MLDVLLAPAHRQIDAVVTEGVLERADVELSRHHSLRDRHRRGEPDGVVHERRARRAETFRLLEAVGLSDRAHFLPRDLSGGQRQRVSIARALAGDPLLILADEPTANLDWKSGEQVIQMLHGITRSEGRTVIIVTHDHRVMPYIDRSVRIEDGKLVA